MRLEPDCVPTLLWHFADPELALWPCPHMLGLARRARTPRSAGGPAPASWSAPPLADGLTRICGSARAWNWC